MMARKPKETPPVGHNSDPAEKDRKVLFFINRRAYNEALAVKKAADAKLKNVAKTVKADLGEYGLQQIKDYDAAQTPEGQERLKAEFEAKAQAMRFAGMPINSQVDLFEDLAPLAERAHAAGEEAGLRGDTLSNPYNESSVEGQDYARGWHEGQAALAAGIKQKQAEGADELIHGQSADPEFPDDEQQLEAAE